MKPLLRWVRFLLMCGLLAAVGCSSPFLQVSDGELAGHDRVEFRGRGTFRLNDLNSRGEIMEVNEIVVTRDHVMAFQYDVRAKRPYSVAKIARVDILRATADYMKFVRLEMRDGVTHWVELFDGKKNDFMAALDRR